MEGVGETGEAAGGREAGGGGREWGFHLEGDEEGDALDAAGRRRRTQPQSHGAAGQRAPPGPGGAVKPGEIGRGEIGEERPVSNHNDALNAAMTHSGNSAHQNAGGGGLSEPVEASVDIVAQEEVVCIGHHPTCAAQQTRSLSRSAFRQRRSARCGQRIGDSNMVAKNPSECEYRF